MTTAHTDSKQVILDRIAAAHQLGEIDHLDHTIVRNYQSGRERDRAELVEILVDRLIDYKAEVHETTSGELTAAITTALTAHEVTNVGIPSGVADLGWLTDSFTVTVDDGSLTAAQIDELDGVVTGLSLASAIEGTIYLNNTAYSGRRILTLVPDLHLVVCKASEIVYGVPEAIGKLDPQTPTTMISGPSATSDIELNRVEGVHGPRTLIVLIVTDA